MIYLFIYCGHTTSIFLLVCICYLCYNAYHDVDYAFVVIKSNDSSSFFPLGLKVLNLYECRNNVLRFPFQQEPRIKE